MGDPWNSLNQTRPEPPDMSVKKEIAVTDNHEVDQDTIEEISNSHDDARRTNFSLYHVIQIQTVPN